MTRELSYNASIRDKPASGSHRVSNVAQGNPMID